MGHLVGRKQYREVSDAKGNPICRTYEPVVLEESVQMRWLEIDQLIANKDFA
jgi:hypothetical protein